jgi:hypothetical protein
MSAERVPRSALAGLDLQLALRAKRKERKYSDIANTARHSPNDIDAAYDSDCPAQ